MLTGHKKQLSQKNFYEIEKDVYLCLICILVTVVPNLNQFSIPYNYNKTVKYEIDKNQ